MAEGPNIPPHAEQSVAAIVELHRSHFRKAGAGQRWVSAATARVARPFTLALIAVAVLRRSGLNEYVTANGKLAPGPLPVRVPCLDGLDRRTSARGHDPDRAEAR
jgi:hypothetical protein